MPAGLELAQRKIRELLSNCSRTRIGQMLSNDDILQMALEYLENPTEPF